MPEVTKKTLYIATTGKGYVHHGTHASPFWSPMFNALVEYFADPSIRVVRTQTGCEAFRVSEAH